MTFCGYNTTMEAAMTKFARGVAIQCDKRAAREGKTTLQVAKAELEELDIFVALATTSPKRTEMAGITGFAMLIRDLFAQMQKVVEMDLSISATDAFAQIIGPFNSLMFEFDRHYFDQPAEANVETKMAALVALAETRT